MALGLTYPPESKSHRVSPNSTAICVAHRLGNPPLEFPPIIPEDLSKFGVESQLIPFVISVTLQVEQSPSGSPPLDTADPEGLVESLDKVQLPP